MTTENPNGILHKVVSGDCMSLIAERYGHDWKKLWNHASNAGLKDKRKNPNVLFDGDEVFVPPREMKQEPAAAERLHRFVRKSTPSKFALRLMLFGKPRSDTPYSFFVNEKVIEGRTDEKGYVRVPLPPGATKGILRVMKGNAVEEYEINLGHLDPLTEMKGVQQRLKNLGYECHVTGKDDEKTRSAISEFQAKNDLDVTGEVGDSTLDALRKVHGA
ncbi:MAG: PGRP and LysM peptidoglycan-binding domain-containing protein [Desulfobacteria bacterium]